MQKPCVQCRQTFEITDADLAFLQEASPMVGGTTLTLPPPALCPQCRLQRRMAFRNVSKLYHRKCDRTGKPIISNHSPDKPYPVYDQSEWFSDAWDAADYAKDIDWNTPFLKQVLDLIQVVPQWGKIVISCENCDYCMNCAECKDCYILVSSFRAMQSYYSLRLNHSTDCADCLRLSDGERCYQCVDCEKLHTCTYMQSSKQCANCDYCFDCESCRDCLLCAGLRQKQYCIFNQQYNKQTYEKALKQMMQKSHAYLIEQLRKGRLLVPHSALRNLNCEDCSGDFLFNCKGLRESYYVSESQDSAYIFDGTTTSLCMDCSDPVEFVGCYEVGNSYKCNRALFCDNVTECSDLSYCRGCEHVHDCFGCVGLRHKQYCILNRQYSKEEYESLVPKIVECMQKSSEWGEFFPMHMSPFGYNETAAQEYFPLTKRQAAERSWAWHDDGGSKDLYRGPVYSIPEAIENVPDDILRQILLCDVTGKPYKIIPQELKFYREMQLPVPRKCPDQRHLERLVLRNPLKLWDRQCMKCKKAIRTTYSPDRPEIVYCEECYLSAVY